MACGPPPETRANVHPAMINQFAEKESIHEVERF